MVGSVERPFEVTDAPEQVRDGVLPKDGDRRYKCRLLNRSGPYRPQRRCRIKFTGRETGDIGQKVV